MRNPSYMDIFCLANYPADEVLQDGQGVLKICINTFTYYNKDVFTMLMQASKNRDFLPQQQEVRNNKVRLRNDIIEYLKNNRVGWSNDDVGSLGSQFVDSLTECLWY